MAKNEALAEKIKALRTAKNMSRSQMANELGVKPTIMWYYETGERVPSLDVLIAIANKFNVSVDWLLGTERKSRRLKLKFKGQQLKEPKTLHINGSREELISFIEDEAISKKYDVKICATLKSNQ